MYGMVNKAIKEYVQVQYGRDAWKYVLAGSLAQDDDFKSMENYSDELTFSLVEAALPVTGKSVDELLEDIGRYWIDFALRSEYGNLLRSAGNSFTEVLQSLDSLHSSLVTAFSELKPPSFWFAEVDEAQIESIEGRSQETLVLHYASQRDGLSSFVIGLVLGLAKMHKVQCDIKQIVKKSDGADHDEFLVEYSS